MKFSNVLSWTSLVTAGSSTVDAVQSRQQAAINARTLVERESLTTLMTVNQDGEHAGYPNGQVEYYADCYGDGSLVMIGMKISTAFRNIEKGSNVSVAIRVGDHGPKERVDLNYPGGISDSTAGSPRVTMTGKVEQVSDDDGSLEKCFLEKHPDAKWWVPGSHLVHDTYWTVFQPTGMHYIGGFGDRAFIGDIPIEEYKQAKHNFLEYIEQRVLGMV